MKSIFAYIAVLFVWVGLASQASAAEGTAAACRSVLQAEDLRQVALQVSSIFKLKHPSKRADMAWLMEQVQPELEQSSDPYEMIVAEAQGLLGATPMTDRQKMAVYLATRVQLFQDGVYDSWQIVDRTGQLTPMMEMKINILLVGGFSTQQVKAVVPAVIRR